MTDPRDIEATLAEMDRKLRELQRELATVSRGEEPEPEPEPVTPITPQAPGPILEQATARVEELGRRIDELTRLRRELDEATRSLIAQKDRAPGGEAGR